MEVKHGLKPAWAALMLLPVAMFLHQSLIRLDQTLPTDQLSLDLEVLQLIGLAVAALASVVVGPHLTALLATALGIAALLGMLFQVPGATELQLMAHKGILLGIVASAGVSSSGAAPGLRYAIMLAAYTAANVALLLPQPQILQVGFGLLLVPLALGVSLLPATVSWWMVRDHPATGRTGATQRSAIVAAAIALILAATATGTHLFWGALSATELPELTNAAAVVALGIPTTLLFVGLQFGNRQARLGLAAGVGAMLISLIVVFDWSTLFLPTWLTAAVIGFGEVLLIPWAWARATSDAHWRAAGPLAVLVLAPPLATAIPGALVPITGAMILALAAIPIGMLGWVADEWVFGEVPGSEHARLR